MACDDREKEREREKEKEREGEKERELSGGWIQGVEAMMGGVDDDDDPSMYNGGARDCGIIKYTGETMANDNNNNKKKMMMRGSMCGFSVRQMLEERGSQRDDGLDGDEGRVAKRHVDLVGLGKWKSLVGAQTADGMCVGDGGEKTMHGARGGIRPPAAVMPSVKKLFDIMCQQDEEDGTVDGGGDGSKTHPVEVGTCEPSSSRLLKEQESTGADDMSGPLSLNKGVGVVKALKVCTLNLELLP